MFCCICIMMVLSQENFLFIAFVDFSHWLFHVSDSYFRFNVILQNNNTVPKKSICVSTSHMLSLHVDNSTTCNGFCRFVICYHLDTIWTMKWIVSCFDFRSVLHHLDKLFQPFTPQSLKGRKWWCMRELWNILLYWIYTWDHDMAC